MAVGVAVGVAVSGGSGVCSVGFEHVCNACVMNLTPEEQMFMHLQCTHASSLSCQWYNYRYRYIRTYVYTIHYSMFSITTYCLYSGITPTTHALWVH